MSAVALPASPATPMPKRLRQAALWVWLGFWLLMLGIGIQEYLREGGQHLWEPVLDYGTSALVSTLLAWRQLRRARKLDVLLDRPWRWFARALTELPLLALGYVAVIYALRHSIRWLAGFGYRHPEWMDVIVYESAKFALFYLLFTGVHFGVRSYLAWTRERLRAEQQARLTQEAQLAQLTQQLQPHFLFNALNTISSLIHGDPDLADSLLTRLATLLRAATDASQRPEHALADELALLEAYADIMSQRFADRVEIAWAIDDAARACSVPTLGLQPLLENCFHHVVEKRRAKTHIAIRARSETGRLVVEISDDGEARVAAPVHGVGLGNLERRLRALHGDAARLTLLPRSDGHESRRSSGLTARVEIPCAC